MTEQTKTLDEPLWRNVLKFDIFLFTVLIVGILAYYQITNLFNPTHDLNIVVSFGIGFTFAGILFLSIRQWKKPQMEKRQ